MTNHNDETVRYARAAIEADPEVPAIRIIRDFAASPAQLLRAHTDPGLVTRWLGPSSRTCDIDYWDARTGGSWRYVAASTKPDGPPPEGFHGCFHEIEEGRIVQTFTWEGMPEQVALERVRFTDLGDGRTRLEAFSLCDSFAARDAALRSGMDVGVHEGYAALDAVLAEQDPITDPGPTDDEEI